MEACLDAAQQAVDRLEEALDAYEGARKGVKALFDYYGSGQWMRDYEADEAGRLPADLKRGVLSEDAVYNLIVRNRELGVRMLRMVAAGLENNTMT